MDHDEAKPRMREWRGVLIAGGSAEQWQEMANDLKKWTASELDTKDQLFPTAILVRALLSDVFAIPLLKVDSYS